MENFPCIVELGALPASLWRNGGGVTRELARADHAVGSGFAWRVSVADIEQSGPFSAFDGYARRLVLLEGTGLYLASAGQRTARLNLAGDQHVFDGGDAVKARLSAGACRVINIMSAHNARGTWTVRPVRDATVLIQGAFILLPVQGRWRAETELDVSPATALIRLDNRTTGNSACRTAEVSAPPGTWLPDISCSGSGLAILLQYHP